MDFINSTLKYNRPFSSDLQLAYVLPPSNHYLLSERNRSILKKEYNNFYTDSFDYKWAFCRYFWESHIMLPEIDIDELHKMETKLISV
jgi:5'-3' exonuclease